MPVRFILNGRPCEESGVLPSTTVLDYLREHLGLIGTKEGCAEGDCGACTIATTRRDKDSLIYEAVNSCLMLVPQLEGKEVLTVEGLADVDGRPHPVQQAIVETHGAQCGYCTPGIVMALFAFHHSSDRNEPENIHDALAGNLCRCTGYRPIVDAALSLDQVPTDSFSKNHAERIGKVDTIEPTSTYNSGGQTLHTPQTIDDLLALRARIPDAYILGGGTDLGIEVSKERKQLEQIIWTAKVRELNHIKRDASSVNLGAAVTYTRALPLLEELYPSFATLVRRIGSRQIRNLGTIGGNVCNASPIGDMSPCLLVLNAVLIARSQHGVRKIPANEFFLDYRKTALADDEILQAIQFPIPDDHTIYRAHKISKRYDQDISSVIGAFALKIRDGKVEKAFVAYGGMAATPKRAKACEAALEGKAWNLATVASAAKSLIKDFKPITDFRASATYRQRIAENLLRRVFVETQNSDKASEVMAL